MQIGIIGLGRMGMNMARRLIEAKHQVVVFNRTKKKVDLMISEGARGASSLENFIGILKKPRVIWLMLPAGDVLETHIKLLSPLLSPGDILADGGNSFYKDAVRRARDLEKKGVHYLDIGVSGGIWGLSKGYCLMVGGRKKVFEAVEPLLQDLAPRDGYLYCGDTGSGHFVKMIHNGIEYGLMQAYGEGFEILRASPYKLPLNKVADLWNKGSVVRSWLLELLAEALEEDGDLNQVAGYVEDSGEGRWTVQQAIDSGVAAPVITLSLFNRFLSRQKEVFSNKVLAALRNKFGGHAVLKGNAVVRTQKAGAGTVRAATSQKGVGPRGRKT